MPIHDFLTRWYAFHPAEGLSAAVTLAQADVNAEWQCTHDAGDPISETRE